MLQSTARRPSSSAAWYASMCARSAAPRLRCRPPRRRCRMAARRACCRASRTSAPVRGRPCVKPYPTLSCCQSLSPPVDRRSPVRATRRRAGSAAQSALCLPPLSAVKVAGASAAGKRCTAGAIMLGEGIAKHVCSACTPAPFQCTSAAWIWPVRLPPLGQSEPLSTHECSLRLE